MSPSSANETDKKQKPSKTTRSDTPTEKEFFDRLPSPRRQALHFQPDDKIQLEIPGENWGGTFRIPPSGVIDLRFVGPYRIAGKTPHQVKTELLNRLQPDYFLNPNLNVNFKSISKTDVLVLGEVKKPSRVSVPRGQGVMDALAEAGSLTQYSKRTRMYVFRNLAGDTSIYKIDYEEYAKGNLTHNLVLKDGDLVYVRTNFWPHFDRLEDVLRPLGFTVNTLATLRFLGNL
ncbi:MAG: polysaccharide biosynthesis/export family protein [bacterium]